MARIISEKLLPTTLHLIELHEQQLKSARMLIRGVEHQIATLKEFVRANYTGDVEAFEELVMYVKTNVGTSHRHYTKWGDDALTARYFNEAREWSTKNAAQQAEVSALREGSTADQVQEVPTTSGNTGAHLPDVESEGGTPD